MKGEYHNWNSISIRQSSLSLFKIVGRKINAAYSEKETRQDANAQIPICLSGATPGC